MARASLPKSAEKSLASMANTKSAKKANRRNLKRTDVNKARRSRMRSSWRGVEEALAVGDVKKAEAALKSAESETMRAVSKKVAHKNAGARKISRLTKRVATLSRAKT
jgi:small subunit ribosomal protein S20